ncbi:MAG: hypothetical protein ABIT01_13845 [Thermoanaerobaculia bacterium]
MSTSSGSRSSASLVFLSLSLLAAACGKKLPPQAPLEVIPARIEPVRLSQEASDVVLRFPYPARTAQGDGLTDLRRVTIYRELVPVRAGGLAPATPIDADAREREEKGFRTRSTPLVELLRADLDGATEGAEVVVRDSLLPLYAEGRIGRVFLRYGLTATRDRKKTSELSPLVAILPLVPPDRPLNLRTTVEEGRVCLDWLRPTAMLDLSSDIKIAAYAVYRRGEKDEAYDAPLGLVKRAETFVDATAEPGKRYLYTVRAAPTAAEPLVLGPAADEVLVDTRDLFPPPAPDGLLVLAEENANRLVWNPILSSDLAHYRVYRWDSASGSFRLLADKLKEPAYVDVSPAGPRYAVSAVDRTGNESPLGLAAPDGAAAKGEGP